MLRNKFWKNKIEKINFFSCYSPVFKPGYWFQVSGEHKKILKTKFWETNFGKIKLKKKTIFLAAIRRFLNQDTGPKLVGSINKF